jgi:acetoin utilization protein AcuB
MLVSRHMTRDPVTITQEEHLSSAAEKMGAGGFRRLPVVEDDRLVGILTDRDLRQHIGFLKETKVSGAMTEEVLTLAPNDTVEAAAHVMLRKKIGGLPVVEDGRLVGIITASDVLEAFLQVTGASEEGTVRLDVVLEGDHYDLSGISRVVAQSGGEVLGLGLHPDRWDERPVVFLRMRADDPAGIADALAEHGYLVLGIHGAPEADRSQPHR